MYRLFYLAEGVGFSLLVTFFLKGSFHDGQPYPLIIFCILTSRLVWPKEGKQYLITLLGFLIGIIVGIIITDLNFSWLFYSYFFLVGFLDRLIRFLLINRKKELIP